MMEMSSSFSNVFNLLCNVCHFRESFFSCVVQSCEDSECFVGRKGDTDDRRVHAEFVRYPQAILALSRIEQPIVL